METQLKQSNNLTTGLVFGTLTIFFFICHLFLEVPLISNTFIQITVEKGGLIPGKSAFFLFSSGACSLLFAISFAKYSFFTYPGIMDEASGVFVVMKAIYLLIILFYAADHQSLFYFILNGLAVLSAILTFFFFAIVFIKLQLPVFIRFFPIFCLLFSTVVFFLTSFIPNLQINLCRDLNDFLNILFVGFLCYFMWRSRTKA